MILKKGFGLFLYCLILSFCFLFFCILLIEVKAITIQQVLTKQINYVSIGVKDISCYHAVTKECDSTPDMGAHGRVAINGVPTGKWVACNSLPFHTRIVIPAVSGDTVWEVRDRTAKRFKHRVDLLVNIGSTCMGLRRAEVFMEVIK